MKILFIRQKRVADEIIPPLHYGYLAGSISRKHEVRILDQMLEKGSYKKMLKTVLNENPDVIGISPYTKDIHSTRELLMRLTKVAPGVKIVVGGVQITLMPKETFQYLGDYIDFGFVGESEVAFSKFIDALNVGVGGETLEEFKNLVWKKNGQIMVNERERPEHLDKIPFPRWELMDPRKYPMSPHGAFYKQHPFAPLITSRGCPFGCTFCAAAAVSGKKVRYRSLDNIFEEIRLLQKKFSVREIHIEDDNFSINKNRVIEFSERMLKENLGITWCFPNGLRLDSLDLPSLELMNKAGCHSVNVGIESGNSEILKRIQKKITKEKIKEKISLVKQAGMSIGGFFIKVF